jgi:hypothetical protein
MYIAQGNCGLCDGFFQFNPDAVPCFPVNTARPAGLTRLDPRGSKEPVCEPCFNETNALRASHGLEPNYHMPSAWGAAEAIG